MLSVVLAQKMGNHIKKKKVAVTEPQNRQTETLGRGLQAEMEAPSSAPSPCTQTKDNASPLHTWKGYRSSASCTVPEFRLATYIFKFVASSISKGGEFLLPHVTLPSPVYSTAFLFSLLPPNKIENFITQCQKIKPQGAEQ